MTIVVMVLALVAIAFAMLVAALALAPLGHAGAESWRAITIGESNDAAEWDELLAYFGATADEVTATVTVAETQAAMAGIYDLSEIDSAYSSTALTCLPPGSGVRVTTRNIEAVTPELYALALVTAGVDDAELVVAAPDDAPALGMTALTGVFSTLEAAPCRPATTSPERQTLALQEMALTADLGQALRRTDGAVRAAGLVLETQRAIVSRGVRDQAMVDAVVAEQEADEGVALPPEQRARLVALMTRLAGGNYDWGSFARGWTAAQAGDGTQITLIGAGSGTRAAAPAGVGGLTQAEAMATVTAPAAPTVAVASPAARAGTPVVVSPATPASAGIPTPAGTPTSAGTPTRAGTPVPAGLPIARSTPVAAAASPAIVGGAAAGSTGSGSRPPDAALVTVAGTVVDGRSGMLAVQEREGDEPVSYMIGTGTDVWRAGERARVADLQPGDSVRMLVDGRTAWVQRIDAEPAAAGWQTWAKRLGWLVPLALIALAAVLFARRRVSSWTGLRRPLRGLPWTRTWIIGRRH